MKTEYDFSDLFLAHRRKTGLTQKGLAAGIGLSESYIRRLEHMPCNLRLETLRKISRYFGKEIGELLGEPAQKEYPEGETLGARLKRLRLNVKLRQEDMIYGKYGKDGDMLRYPELENGHGNPTIRTLYKISRRMDVVIGDLVDGTIR